MSKIEWTERTWNPIVGCSVVSPGCTNCYAMKMAARLDRMGVEQYAGITKPSKAGAVWTGETRLVDSALTLPLRTRKPTTWFVNSMSDLFHESIPDEWIDRVFAVMALCPQHTFQVLTKRSSRMRAYMDSRVRMLCGNIGGSAVEVMLEHTSTTSGGVKSTYPLKASEAREAVLTRLRDGALSNVWLGVSAEDQRRADERVPDLLVTPAAVRFVSAEPMLGPIDFTRISLGRKPGIVLGETRKQDRPETFLVYRDALMDSDGAMERLDWIIVGGESGPGARPMHPAWVRSIRDQCAAEGVAFHFKQHGAWADVGPHPRGEFVSSDPQLDPTHCDEPVFMAPIGKKAAGRLLDGVEHNGMPGESA